MDKVAFITGANRGIGFETSKRLAKAGIKVIIGSRSLNKGKEAKKRLANVLYKYINLAIPPSMKSNDGDNID